MGDDGQGFPVAYPAASRPQAWAAAAPLLLLRAWLGLEVDVPHRRLWLSPAPPPGIERMVRRGLAIGRDRIDNGWSGGGLDEDGLPAGMEVIRQRAPAGIDGGSATGPAGAARQRVVKRR